MKDIVTIAPLGDEPGLVAYECSRCRYITCRLQFTEAERATLVGGGTKRPQQQSHLKDDRYAGAPDNDLGRDGETAEATSPRKREE
jgi:hypothetical protein